MSRYFSIGERKLMPCIHTIIMISLMLGGNFLPQPGSVTSLGTQIIGIFAGIIYGWSTLGMIIPSILGIFFIGQLNGNAMITTLSTAFGDRITIILLFFLIFSGLVKQVGLSKYIADWCTNCKLVQGKPWGIAIMFCLAAGAIAATVNMFAAMILMWGIFYSFCDEMKIKPLESYPVIVLIGIIYSASIFGGLFPFMGGSLIVVGQQISFTGLEVDFAKFTFLQIVMITLSLTMFFLVAKFIFKPDIGFIKNQKLDESRSSQMSEDQKLVFILLMLIIVILFAPGFLPEQWQWVVWLKSIDIAIVPAMMVVLYYIYKSGQENKIEFSNLLAEVNWDIIFMFATVAVLSKSFVREEDRKSVV